MKFLLTYDMKIVIYCEGKKVFQCWWEKSFPDGGCGVGGGGGGLGGIGWANVQLVAWKTLRILILRFENV